MIGGEQNAPFRYGCNPGKARNLKVFADAARTCPSEQDAPEMVKVPTMKSVLAILCLTLAINVLAGEPSGRWKTPSKDGRPWKHAGTGLSFPTMLGGFRLAGEFQYEKGGSFIRYENLEERVRADIFFFPVAVKAATVEEQQRLILQEMDSVTTDFDAMVKQGRYKNLSIGPLGGGSIDLWMKDDAPLAARVITATRIGQNDDGVVEAVLKQWVGITYFENHLITIRQMRPISTGDAGEEGFKNFGGMIFQIIKDPALRADISRMIDLYLADPFSDDSVQATGAVLAYLKQTPFYPISIPEYPISDWLENSKKVAPGTEGHLLSAFMLASAKAAFADGDAATCLKAGAKQFALIYRQLAVKNPQIKLPEIEDFAAATESGHGGEWLTERAGIKQ